MSKATAIQAKFAAAMSKYKPYRGLAYKRNTSKTGGDTVTGKGASINIDDVLLDPQPIAVSILANSQLMANVDSVNPATDLSCTISGAAISVAELTSKTLTLVFKDAKTNTEQEYSVVYWKDISLGGEVALFSLIIRSRKQS